LKAEVVLALANVIWFVLLGLGGVVVPLDRLPGGMAMFAKLLPSGALTETLRAATIHTSVDVAGLAVLLVWGLLAGLAATRTFRFT
jgi:ABC-2 type transport system permease protein